MQTSGRTTGGRLALGFALLAVFAGAALAAAEVCVVDIPAGDSYYVSATLVPGGGGAEVADIKGQGHVNFRIAFGCDQALTVNGSQVGCYDPSATYLVTVDCRRVAIQWFATIRVVNGATGAMVYEQMDYPMAGASDQVRAVAGDVVQLSAE